MTMSESEARAALRRNLEEQGFICAAYPARTPGICSASDSCTQPATSELHVFTDDSPGTRSQATIATCDDHLHDAVEQVADTYGKTADTERSPAAVQASILARNLIAAETEDVLLYGQNDNELHPDYRPAMEAVRDFEHFLLVAGKLASFASSAIRELAQVRGEDPRATLHWLTAEDCGH